MRLFLGVSVAICSSSVRTALEALFAELSVVFVTHVADVVLGTLLAFAAALLVTRFGLSVTRFSPQSAESGRPRTAWWGPLGSSQRVAVVSGNAVRLAKPAVIDQLA